MCENGIYMTTNISKFMTETLLCFIDIRLKTSYFLVVTDTDFVINVGTVVGWCM